MNDYVFNLKYKASVDVKELTKINKATQDAVNGKGSKSAAKTSQDLAKLNKEMDRAKTTSKGVAAGQSLLNAVYAEGSHIIDRQYLNSLHGLRIALRKLNEEFKETKIYHDGLIKSLSNNEFAMNRFAIKANLTARTLDNMARTLINTGKNAQWTGRQLMVGVTAPLVGIGYKSVQAARELDQVNVHIRKLVGLAPISLKLLDTQTRKLSQTFGMARVEIAGIQEIFAEIGANSKDIQNLTRLTVEFSKLGNVDPTKAAEMVRVLHQTGIGAKELQTQLFKLNAINNGTNITMDQLAEALPKISPLMRQFGVDASNTAALVAGITQSGMDAGEAANALKMALVKLAPAMAGDPFGKGKGGGQGRLKYLRDSIELARNLTGEQLSLFKSDGTMKDGVTLLANVARAWGILRDKAREGNMEAANAMKNFERAGFGERVPQMIQLFEQFNNAMRDGTGDLAKALKIASDSSDAAAEKWARQLGAVKAADVTKLAGQIERLKNLAQEIGRTLIPMLIDALQWVDKWIDKFNNLDESTKKTLIKVAAGLAALGPVTYAAGQGMLVLGQTARIAFTGPFKLITTILHRFEDNIGGVKGVIGALGDAFDEAVSNRNIEGMKAVANATLAMADASTKAAVAATAQAAATERVAGVDGLLKSGFNGVMGFTTGGALQGSMDPRKLLGPKAPSSYLSSAFFGTSPLGQKAVSTANEARQMRERSKAITDFAKAAESAGFKLNDIVRFLENNPIEQIGKNINEQAWVQSLANIAAGATGGLNKINITGGSFPDMMRQLTQLMLAGGQAPRARVAGSYPNPVTNAMLNSVFNVARGTTLAEGSTSKFAEIFESMGGGFGARMSGMMRGAAPSGASPLTIFGSIAQLQSEMDKEIPQFLRFQTTVARLTKEYSKVFGDVSEMMDEILELAASEVGFNPKQKSQAMALYQERKGITGVQKYASTLQRNNFNKQRTQFLLDALGITLGTGEDAGGAIAARSGELSDKLRKELGFKQSRTKLFTKKGANLKHIQDLAKISTTEGLSRAILSSYSLPKEFWEMVGMRLWGGATAEDIGKLLEDKVDDPRIKTAIQAAVARTAMLFGTELGFQGSSAMADIALQVHNADTRGSKLPYVSKGILAGASGISDIGAGDLKGLRSLVRNESLTGIRSAMGRISKPVLDVLEESIVNEIDDLDVIDQMLGSKGYKGPDRRAIAQLIRRNRNKFRGRLLDLDEALGLGPVMETLKVPAKYENVPTGRTIVVPGSKAPEDIKAARKAQKRVSDLLERVGEREGEREDLIREFTPTTGKFAGKPTKELYRLDKLAEYGSDEKDELIKELAAREAAVKSTKEYTHIERLLTRANADLIKAKEAEAAATAKVADQKIIETKRTLVEPARTITRPVPGTGTANRVKILRDAKGKIISVGPTEVVGAGSTAGISGAFRSHLIGQFSPEPLSYAPRVVKQQGLAPDTIEAADRVAELGKGAEAFTSSVERDAIANISAAKKITDLAEAASKGADELEASAKTMARNSILYGQTLGTGRGVAGTIVGAVRQPVSASGLMSGLTTSIRTRTKSELTQEAIEIAAIDRLITRYGKGQRSGRIAGLKRRLSPSYLIESSVGFAQKAGSRIKDGLIGSQDAGLYGPAFLTGKEAARGTALKRGGLLGLFKGSGFQGKLGAKFMGGETGSILKFMLAWSGVIAVVAVGILLIIKNWNKVRKGITDGIGALKKGFGTLLGAIIGPFKAMMDRLSGGKKAGAEMATMWKSVGQILNVTFKLLGGAMKIVAEVARPIFTAIAITLEVIARLISGIILLFTGKGTAALKQFGKMFGVIFYGLRQILGFFVKAIIETYTLPIRTILTIVEKLAGKFKNIPVVGGIFKKIANAAKGAKDVINGATDSIVGFVKGAGNAYNKHMTLDLDVELNKRAQKKLTDKIKEEFKDFEQVKKSDLTKIGDTAVSYFQAGIKKGFKRSKAQAVGNAFKDVVKEALSEGASVEDAVNYGKHFATSMYNALHKHPKMSIEDAMQHASDITEYLMDKIRKNTDDPVDVGADTSGLEESLNDASDLVSAFHDEIMNVTGGWKEAVTKAFETWADNQQKALEKAHEAQVEAIDKEIEAINKQKDAEQELEYWRQYAEKQDELRRKKRHNAAVYQRELDKAVYEGNYDQAKTLYMDRQEQIEDETKEETDLVKEGEDHKREAERQAQLNALDERKRQLDKQYDLDKEALDNRLELARQGLEDELAQAARYAARSESEARAQKDRMLGILANYTDKQGKIGAEGANAWGKQWNSAFEIAKKDVADKAFWAGNDALTAFAKGLGVPEDVAKQIVTNATGTPNTSTPANSSGHGVGEISYGTGGRQVRHSGGTVGPMTGGPYDVPITAQAGEYVIQRKAVKRLGLKTLDKINNAHKYHSGGMVDIADAGMTQLVDKVGQAVKAYPDLGDTLGAGLGSALGVIPESFVSMLKGLVPGAIDLARLVFGALPSAIITSTTSGKHTKNSLHYVGRAIDFDMIPNSLNDQIYSLLEPMAKRGILEELFYDPRGGWDKGAFIGAIGGHMNHVHAAIASAYVNGLIATLGGHTTAGGTPQAIVKSVMQNFGWGEDQWPSLNQLVSHESGWNPSAANPTSTARGLFQFLKSTWQSYITNAGGPSYWNTDVNWQARGGLQYIKSRYGSPNAAWDFWQRNHWYHRGGMVFDVPKLDTGGWITKSGIAEVHKGERVLNTNEVGDMGKVDINIHLGTYLGSDRELEKLVDTIESRIIPKINRARGLEARTRSSY